MCCCAGVIISIRSCAVVCADAPEHQGSTALGVVVAVLPKRVTLYLDKMRMRCRLSIMWSTTYHTHVRKELDSNHDITVWRSNVPPQFIDSTMAPRHPTFKHEGPPPIRELITYWWKRQGALGPPSLPPAPSKKKKEGEQAGEEGTCFFFYLMLSFFC